MRTAAFENPVAVLKTLKISQGIFDSLKNFNFLIPQNWWLTCSLTLSCWRSLSQRNQSIDLLCKSMGRFLYDRGVRHERVNILVFFRRDLAKFIKSKKWPFQTIKSYCIITRSVGNKPENFIVAQIFVETWLTAKLNLW